MRNLQFASAFGLLLLLGSCTTHRDPRIGSADSTSGFHQTHQRLLEEPSDARTAEAATWAENNCANLNCSSTTATCLSARKKGAYLGCQSGPALAQRPRQPTHVVPKSAARVGQLRGLAQAITSGAAKGGRHPNRLGVHRPRDEAELAIGRDVVRALEETQQLAERGIGLWQKTAARADSLQTVCRSRLAKAIIEGE